MKYKISKGVRDFMLVTLRKDMFVKASKFSRPFGVYTIGGIRRTIGLEGNIIDTIIPKGVIIKGESNDSIFVVGD